MLSSTVGTHETEEHLTASRHAGQLTFWLLLLGLAELADLITTRADRLGGGIEANQVAAFALGVGGPGLFWGLKVSLVLAMVAIVLLALHFARSFPGGRANIVRACVARSLQVCVLLLTAAAVGNVAVLAHVSLLGGFV